MTLQAHITTEAGQPWLWITQPGQATGERWCVFDAPLDLRTKQTTKAEIDFAHERSGIPRPDLYDAIRAYNHQQRTGQAA